MRRRRRHLYLALFCLLLLLLQETACCPSHASGTTNLQLRNNDSVFLGLDNGRGRQLQSLRSGDENSRKDGSEEDGDGKAGSEGIGKEELEMAEKKPVLGFLVAKNSSEAEEIGEAAVKGIEKLVERVDEEVQTGAGRFNETIEKQEGVLETVARVGKHSLENDEAEGTDKKSLAEVGKQFAQKDADLTASEQNKTTEEDHDTNIKDLHSQSLSELRDRIIHNADPVEGALPPPLNSTASKDTEPTNATKDKAQDRHYQVEDVARLIDRQDNEYVISNPGKQSQMQLQEDLILISDIGIVLVAAAIGGLVCGLLGQPVILGYLAAGMVVGPGGFGLVHELVQVETLAQFGVVFLLFALGVEFNISKMQGVQGVALSGGCVQILTAMFLGGVIASSAPQGVFIGAFLSMSSTAVVVKCLVDGNIGDTAQGQIMLGTLILQDCALGLLLAVMPALAAKGSSSGTFIFALGRESLLLSGFCLFAWILAKFLIPWFLTTLTRLSKHSQEIYQLGIVGICLCIALLSQTLGLSLEVGSFIAGLMLSGAEYSEKTLHQIEPIRNMFAALFLAAIGMVIHPLFLWQHKDVLLASLVVVVFGKTCLIALVVRVFGYNISTAISVGIALAQIGEFSFLLLSRAQTLGLVSRKLYLLLMGTSALSLVLTPFAFKIVIRLILRDKRNEGLPYSISSAFAHKDNNHHDTIDKKIGWQHATKVLVNNEQESDELSGWTVPSISASLVSNLDTDSVGDGLTCDKSPKLVDSESEQIDRPHESRMDMASLPHVTLRRPFSQVLSRG